MKARNILLNHFSQRYPKLPRLPTASPGDDESGQPVVSFSFDLMSIRVGDMWKMAHYMDAISELFKEADPEEGDNTAEAVEHDVNGGVDEDVVVNEDDTPGQEDLGTGEMNSRVAVSVRGGGNKAQKLAAKARRKEVRLGKAVGLRRSSPPAKRSGSPSHPAPTAKRSKAEGADSTPTTAPSTALSLEM
jgi:ribonuclease Z